MFGQLDHPERLVSPRRLRVARWKPSCRVLGPGRRAVVWFQGCTLGCPKCIAGEMNASSHGQSLTPEELADRVIRTPSIEGVTLTGGEPFQQPLDAQLSFLQHLRVRSNLSIMCYTGYTWDQLHQGSDASLRRQILQQMDVLVDGPYVWTRNDGHRWRGSSNQRFHFLSDRYRAWEKQWAQAMDRTLEIDLPVDGKLLLAGIPDDEFLARFSSQLRTYGVAADFASSQRDLGRAGTGGKQLP